MNAGKKRVIGISAVLLVVIVAVAGTATLRRATPDGAISDPAANPLSGAALTVSVVSPIAVLWPEVITASGAIAPWQEASVAAQVGGVRLIEVLADVGDEVVKGQLLARLDPAPVEANYAQQRAALADAQARLTEALANAARAKHLRDTSAISEQDLIRAITTAQAAQAQVDLAEARLSSQQLNLDDTRVIAPDDGVVSSRSAMLGAVAAPGMELFRLVRQNRLEWRAELASADIANVEVSDRAEIRLPDGSIIDGVVRQIAPVLDAGSRMGIVYVALSKDANSGDARPGMFLSDRILRRERAGLALPATALVVRDGYEFVFVVDAESRRAMQIKVKTGRRHEGSIEIVSGVNAGDQVVASGGAFLNDGDLVRIVPPQVATASAERRS